MSIIRKCDRLFAEQYKGWDDYPLYSIIVDSLADDEKAQLEIEFLFYEDLKMQGLTDKEAYRELDKIVLELQGYVLGE